MSSHRHTPLERARLSLEGLSVADALGERLCLHTDIAGALVAARALPAAPWQWTDDTQMALSVVAVLRNQGGIDPESLARSFADHCDASRGYSAATLELLGRLRAGGDWRVEAGQRFGGRGSWGNGAAMRVAPVGAYFAENLAVAAEQARCSAVITHAHPEAVAGAIAVAVAAALASRASGAAPSARDFLLAVATHLPESAVRLGIERAAVLDPATPVGTAALELGNGARVSAQDTVPFALWCAATSLGDYTETFWRAATGLGDMDTNCAIACGISVLAADSEAIPTEWLAAREPLPGWPFVDDPDATVTLYRPVGDRELARIAHSNWREFPPRLPEQPIFYPVCNETYARQIARDWNSVDAKHSFIGHVTRFRVRESYLSRYAVQVVGNGSHQEYWIPAEELPEFNANIIGEIEVIATYDEGRERVNLK